MIFQLQMIFFFNTLFLHNSKKLQSYFPFWKSEALMRKEFNCVKLFKSFILFQFFSEKWCFAGVQMSNDITFVFIKTEIEKRTPLNNVLIVEQTIKKEDF